MRLNAVIKTGLLGLVIASSTACSSWMYKMDIPQGNYLEQRNIDKLRVGMSKEQVTFVLGTPVVKNSFNKETWVYLYHMRSGRTDEVTRKEFRLSFEADKLTDIQGDFDKPEDFNTPLDI